ncbi:MAG: glucose 1-dehydrogenase [Rhodospirillales bacterium]
MYLERFRLDNRRAVVTGGGRGIGFEICRALAEAGAEIVIAEIDPDSGAEAASRLAGEGFTATSRVLDVTQPDQVTALADELDRTLGPVDILVNNAGVARVADVLDTTDDDWNLTMKVNSDAAFWCSRAFGRHMKTRGAGAIVNIGSMCGMIVTRPQNAVPYMASKGAIHMLTKSLACAWAKDGIRVNAVAPAYVATEMTMPLKTENPVWYDAWVDMTPMGRLGETKEIASAVLFLASEAASYCTGTVLSVDGGYTAW